MAVKKQEGQIAIEEITMEEIAVCIKGTTPFICSAMSSKARQELILPKIKNKAAQAATLKHDPMREFVESAYMAEDDDDYPTRILMLPTAFKRAMAQAAIDIPGNAAKTQIGRLTYVQGAYIPLYGVPKMMMSVTRNSDIKKTPDIRTRIVIENWACILSISYMRPQLNRSTIYNLLRAAGTIVGVGDWRQEKGSGNYGLFQPCDPEDAEFVEIMKAGREIQDAAIADPEFFDRETKTLFKWFQDELRARGEKAAPEGKKRATRQA